MKRHNTRNQPPQAELSWRRLVLGKWLNISANNSDYTADVDSGSESDSEFIDWPTVKNEKPAGVEVDTCDTRPTSRRRKSETFRTQYINTKEIRICAATWNVGGTVPPDDLDLDSWLDIDDPAHIYVIGLQEMIPLNAGNIFGAEDNRPISRWENIIRETLNRVRPANKYKSYSDPPSPSRFKPSEDAPDIIEEILLESDSDVEEGIYTLNEESNDFDENRDEQKREDIDENVEEPCTIRLTKSLSGTERIGLSWPEPPLHLLPHAIERSNFFKGSKSLKSSKSFETSKSFRAYGSFRSNTIPENRIWSDLASLAELDLESLINQTRRPPFVRIISKQMVGVFITIWVRRSLRRHIQNLNVSTVGVGVMGYIGNKSYDMISYKNRDVVPGANLLMYRGTTKNVIYLLGSISVSMSIHQTLFCFICTHLTSGEKEADVFKRNADVNEIHKRTRFSSRTVVGLPKRIYDHERIIWLGDLNYRVNLSYEKTRELVSKNDLSKLMEHDQLIKEFKKGHAFDGWSEGIITFAPTYKYELDSDSYIGGDPTKPGRRTPAWCDRILSFGTGMKLISYRRSEIKLSDHRPVTASYVVDVEVFSSRKLQKALTFTDAEIEEHDGILDRSETR